MDKIIDAIVSFISKLTTAAIIGSSLLLVAGEVRLAALKKATQGSTNLSSFTKKMTQTKLR